jgi:hypothetical protein
MNIKLINKSDGLVCLEYESPVTPLKNEIIIANIKGEEIEVKVEQVNHFVIENRMARQNELDYVGVIVKPVVKSM